jgi:hypothetical protein
MKLKGIRKNAWDVEKGLVDGYFFEIDKDDEKYPALIQEDLFHIGYNDESCKTFYCLNCGGKEFYVGQNEYYTAVKCKNCLFEQLVHSG